MKKLVQQEDLQAYLKELAAASMLVVSMTTPMLEISSTLKSTYEVAYVVENYGQYIGKGPYMIESKEAHEWKEPQIPDPVISGYAIAFSVRATMRAGSKGVGGHHSLRKALADYECLHMANTKSEDMVSSILIRLPTDPMEMQKLREILLEYSVMFSIDDGSGVFHLGNTLMGNGVYHS
ncbi:hypothetical protein LU688_16540 [Pseudomonas soli]|uniref:hypothetical protein n=1 Tax=Pseudomonas soli TaxID=1306993 RepID=UPI001E534655|nr:hypothetical protein [Pseudomonas soli]WJO19897.1 hypothetical protein LU688_16540 [Pseudomonas soli]